MDQHDTALARLTPMMFADETPDPVDKPVQTPTVPWCVLLVDDDAEVHTVTKLALRGFEFQGKGLVLLSATSAKQGREIFEGRSDIALAIIDVVMETEHAGLDLVHCVRNTLDNHRTRLVLRTGQPGQAPEDKVIRDYDIDDYKEKTELTLQKLRTLLYSKLRAYRDLCVIEQQRDGLSRVMQATSHVQNASSLTMFASAVLSQLTSLLHLDHSALYCVVLPTQKQGKRESRTLAATGDFVHYRTGQSFADLPPLVAERFQTVLDLQRAQHFDDAYVMFTPSDEGGGNLLYVNHASSLGKMDRQLLELYTQSVAITFENMNLQEDLQETQKELVYILADAVEARSKETGAHVKRVALCSEVLARLYGLPEKEVMLIKHASPLHDIGKVAIPDAILHKPGKLDAIEWETMQKHAQFGLDILQRSSRPLMKMGSIIAISHHERWDGTGYPNGLAGEAIPLAGRITALIDVFDALGSRRSYKQAWSDQSVIDLILQERGKQFDPSLVDLLMANLNTFRALREQFPDSQGAPAH
jgi:response regulator RpfG family c-di-GMP phosphodiesterase